MKPSHPQSTKKHYIPPRQSTIGQMLDSVFLLALVYISLMLPLILGHGGDKAEAVSTSGSTWEQLSQNATMADQWGKLGFTPETAAPIIQSRFDTASTPSCWRSRLRSSSAITFSSWPGRRKNIRTSLKSASANKISPRR